MSLVQIIRVKTTETGGRLAIELEKSVKFW
jgi:hypothetical protein